MRKNYMTEPWKPESVEGPAAADRRENAKVLDQAEMNVLEAFKTNGKRANGERVFELPFSGNEIYWLLRFFEQQAVRAAGSDAGYAEVRAAVLWAEKIRQRARDKGF